MKRPFGNRLRTRRKTSLRRVVLVTSVAFTIAGIGVFLLHLRNPEKAMAADCDSSYVLNWSDPTTYTVTCGDVNASNWTVKGKTCVYYSPLLQAGGSPGDPDKESDISVRINQSGNLDGNDTAWVYLYVNGEVMDSFRCLGDSTSAVFTVTRTLVVPADGNYQISIRLKNDKSNETWQIKNNDVMACLRSMNPLPISLGNFTARATKQGEVQLKWNTFTEKNNHYFTMERSVTGNNFTEIGRMEGAGNSNSNRDYEFTDENPTPGINYYRLKQTDYDGTSSHSSIIKVAVSKKSREAGAAMEVFPNPFSEMFSVRFHSDEAREVTVRVISTTGQVVFSNAYEAEAGENTITCSLPRPLNKGNYVIQTLTADQVLASAKAISQ